MQIILLQDVRNLGKKGQIKDVSDGYARNFLLVKKLAVMATPSAIARIKLEDEKKNQQLISEKKEVQELVQALNGKEITLRSRAKEGKLFGSITAKEIALEIKKNGYVIPEKAVPDVHLKELGEKRIILNLDFGLKAEIILTVEEE